MVEHDRGDFLETQALGGEHAAVTREDCALLVDENRDIEPERCDALGDAGDLLVGVDARVSLIRPQRLDQQPAHRNPLGRLFAARDAIRDAIVLDRLVIWIGTLIGSRMGSRGPQICEMCILSTSLTVVKNKQRIE
jgi:hypothetical protein